MSASKVRLVLTPHGAGSRVFIDGQEIKSVRSITLTPVKVDSPTTLTLELIGVEVEVDGDVSEVTKT